jgi:hypothetical protein
MVKGAASQVSTAVPRGGRNATGAPAGSSGVRRRTGKLTQLHSEHLRLGADSTVAWDAQGAPQAPAPACGRVS